MSGTVIGTAPCSRCAARGKTGTMRYSQTSSGGVSGSCDTCKRQTFDRSPSPVEGLNVILSRGKKPPGESVDPPAAKGEAFDLTKI
jgi:hypothetical protein